MSTSVDRRELDHLPDEETIVSFREAADEQGVTIEARYPSVDGEKRLVVSPRGTVTVLNDVSEATFNRSQSAVEIADALRE